MPSAIGTGNRMAEPVGGIRVPTTTKQEWRGRGWRATARTGGAIASYPELLALRVRTAKAVYPWFAGPAASAGELPARCVPCGGDDDRSSLFWSARRTKSAGRGDDYALVDACCPPGKHVHVPDAVFLRRGLTFAHDDSGVELRFAPEDAVRGCMLDAAGPDLAPPDAMPRPVVVRHAERWLSKGERLPSAYDWTYSTRWWGCPVRNGAPLEGVEDPAGALPMRLLAARDEVLWHQELEQYFDDLGDEGNATHVVRARVMPGFFFVLARLELTVLNVVARQVDARWLHVFGSGELVREWSWRELPFRELRARKRPWQPIGPALLRPSDTRHRVFHRFRMP